MPLDLLSLSMGTIERLAMVRLDEPIAELSSRAPKTAVFWILREVGHRGVSLGAWGARHSALEPTLRNAAILGDAEWCRVMVEGGAAVSGHDLNGRTALMRAAEFGHGDTVRLLVALGANVDGQDDYLETGAWRVGVRWQSSSH